MHEANPGNCRMRWYLENNTPSAGRMFWAYGRRTKVSGSLDADFGFAGMYFHAASGLSLTLFRAYSPDLGRWLSRDPAAEGGSGLNLYAYVFNDPINGVDPLGLSWATALHGFAVGVLTSAAVVAAAAFAVGVGVVTAPVAAAVLAAAGVVGLAYAAVEYATADSQDERDEIAGGVIGGLLFGGLSGKSMGRVFGSSNTGSGKPCPNAVQGPKKVDISPRNLQKIFDKHGSDFGLTGNWNPSRAADVANAINTHVNNPETQVISGSYRGTTGVNYVNPNTGLNVFTDNSGNVIGAWKLGANQLQSVLTTGRLF
jgi:RHS repeat-associated protein